MRILLTVHQFFPDFKAGTEVLTLSVAKELIRRGHEVCIFTGYPTDNELSDDERFDEYIYDEITIYRFHHSYVPMLAQTSLIEIGYNNQLSRNYFSQVLKIFKPDLVHHFHLNRLGIGVINLLADHGIPQFFTPTDFWMICPTAQLILKDGQFCSGPDKLSGNCIKHFAQNSVNGFNSKLISFIPDLIIGEIAKITKGSKLIDFPMHNEVDAMSSRLDNTISALNRLQGIVAPNRFMVDLFLRYGVNSRLIHEINFGIDIDRKNINLPLKNLEAGKCIRLGFIGTLAPHKGCHIAIDAVKSLPDGFASLTIYGSGADFPEYVKSLEESIIPNDNIKFCGTFPNKDIFTIFESIDVLIVPSVWFENTPLVIYSAQASNCPVIGSDLPGISAVIKHGINGLLFKAGDSDDLSKKIKEMKVIDVTAMSACAIPPKTSVQYVDDLNEVWRVVAG
ncbi:glycosyltransferase [Phytobacter diazotrophicus]|uniref:glycosyltransferase n=1 Tax=Phytobacter diazotrophicus TaxID=395631 RepID=UPI002912C6F8|nr:glycosyltransferase [Phytobacter diazotrophicus]MDU7198518.1 glycosyltransferase [Enterobacteriaceae bacterium]MDV2871394.1 glycosyltransferase [Phytobacter diazotrophicus]